MSKVRVTLTVDGEVLAAADEAAWSARLSRSAYVEQQLRFGVNQKALREDGVASGALDGPAPDVRKAGAARTGLCEHRVPAAAYCPRCGS